VQLTITPVCEEPKNFRFRCELKGVLYEDVVDAIEAEVRKTLGQEADETPATP